MEQHLLNLRMCGCFSQFNKLLRIALFLSQGLSYIFISHMAVWAWGLGSGIGFLGLYLMGFENSGVRPSRFFGVGAL